MHLDGQKGMDISKKDLEHYFNEIFDISKTNWHNNLFRFLATQIQL